MGIWSAADGYGAQFKGVRGDRGDRPARGPFLQREGWALSGSEGAPHHAASEASAVTILKPHGSLNWLCQLSGNYGFGGSATCG